MDLGEFLNKEKRKSFLEGFVIGMVLTGVVMTIMKIILSY